MESESLDLTGKVDSIERGQMTKHRVGKWGLIFYQVFLFFWTNFAAFFSNWFLGDWGRQHWIIFGVGSLTLAIVAFCYFGVSIDQTSERDQNRPPYYFVLLLALTFLSVIISSITLSSAPWVLVKLFLMTATYLWAAVVAWDAANYIPSKLERGLSQQGNVDENSNGQFAEQSASVRKCEKGVTDTGTSGLRIVGISAFLFLAGLVLTQLQRKKGDKPDK